MLVSPVHWVRAFYSFRVERGREIGQSLFMTYPYRPAALFCLLLTGTAFAQAGAPEAAHGVLYAAGMFLLANSVPLLFAAIVATLLPLAFGWIAAQRKIAVSSGKSTVLLDIAEKLAHLAQLAVASSDAKNLVGDLAARAAKGELTAADGVALKTDAMTMVKNWVSPDGLKQIAVALGTPAKPADPSTVDSYIAAHVEHAVDTKNNTAAAAEAGGSPAPAVPAPA